MRIHSKLGAMLALALGLVLGACHNEGPMERAGKEVDKAVDQTANKAREGTGEQMGKKVDDAVEKAGEKIDQAADKAGDKMKEMGEAVKEKTEQK